MRLGILVLKRQNNGKGGIGEIGFFKGHQDKFGDKEKLVALKRALSIAYDQGFGEFMIWEAGSALKIQVYISRN